MKKARSSMDWCVVLVGIQLSFLSVVGCDLTKFVSADEKAKVEEVYKAYSTAIASGDVAVVKQHLTQERVKEIEGADAAALSMIQALYPKGANITTVKVSGNSATVTLSGQSNEGTVVGAVNLVKQESIWKVDKESWQIKISMQKEQPEAIASAGISRPHEYEKLIGSWKGHEAGQATDDWEFTFNSNFVVSVTGPKDQRYRGIALADWDLGAEGGKLRVLRGGAIFDLRTIEAPDPQFVGKTSLGSFKLSGETLQFCGSQPGLLKRTSEFVSRDGIRCFELTRLSDAAASAAPQNTPSQPRHLGMPNTAPGFTDNRRLYRQSQFKTDRRLGFTFSAAPSPHPAPMDRSSPAIPSGKPKRSEANKEYRC